MALMQKPTGPSPEDTTESNENAISTAREVLDRSGLVKKEQIEVTNTGGGMFILPPKTSKDDQTAPTELF